MYKYACTDICKCISIYIYRYTHRYVYIRVYRDVKMWVNKRMGFVCAICYMCGCIYSSFDSLPIKTKHKKQADPIILLYYFHCDISYCWFH